MRVPSILALLNGNRRVALATLCVVASALLTACGGGGTTSDNGATSKTTISNSGTVQTGLRTLDPTFGTLKAVSYSPFRSADQGSETPLEEDVLVDMQLLHAAGFKLIRLFSSSEKVAGMVLKVLAAHKELPIKVQLGAYPNTFEYWVTDPVEKAKIQGANDDELARTVAYANSYPDIILAVSVGNETMVSWSTVPISTKQMAKYVRTVRGQITQPVTVDDDWSVYSGGLPHHAAENQVAEVLAEIDYVSMHTYAHEAAKYDLFDWRQKATDVADLATWLWTWFEDPQISLKKRSANMMEAAMAKTRQDFSVVRSYLDRVGKAKLPLVVGETGWKAAQVGGSGQYRYYSSPANQKMYYDRLIAWSKESGGPFNIFYFEAFDEPWKSGDDGWGLFNVDRKARYVIQDTHKFGVPTNSRWLDNDVVSGSLTWRYSVPDSTTPLYFTSPESTMAQTSNKFYIYGDSIISGDGLLDPQYWTSPVNALGIKLDGFDDHATASEVSGNPLSSDGGQHWKIVPRATLGGSVSTQKYGWGMLYHPNTAYMTANLSAYQSGSLKFSVRTTYPGKIKIGISTDTADGVAQEAYVLLGDGDYGYCRNGTSWCQVTLPISALLAVNPKLDMSRVLNRFVIADIFADTKKDATSSEVNNLPSIYLDAIYYSK